MHEKYSNPALEELVTSTKVVKRNLQILAVVAEAQHLHGVFECVDLPAAILSLDPRLLYQFWLTYEKELKHETAGFVKAVRRSLPAQYAPFVYLGMTSNDLMDTAAAMLWDEIWEDHLRPDVHALGAQLTSLAQESDQRMGRTHGRLAEPVEIGASYSRAFRALENVNEDLGSHYIPGKLSGPVGQHNAALTREVESHALRRLGLSADACASQIVDRHFYRRVATDLVELACICEQLATLHRLSAIQGVDTFAEGFHDGVQMGSSVMPFKRNPIRSERICGLARIARSSLSALLETWSTSWWERSLDNSSVERTAWWDLIQLTSFILGQTSKVLDEGQWRNDIPADYVSPTDELIQRSINGQVPEDVYREIQARSPK